MKLVSIGWTAQSEIAAALGAYRPTLPELFPGQAANAAEAIGEVAAALKHPETDAAVLIVGSRAEVAEVVEPIRRQWARATAKERLP